MVTSVPLLWNGRLNSYGTVVSTVMERPSQLRSLWITCSVPCKLITKDLFVEKVVCLWHPSRKHIVMFVHRLFINSLFSIVFECFSLKIVPKNSGNAKKRAEKSLSSSPRSPITMRSKPLFQILCHHSGKPIC